MRQVFVKNARTNLLLRGDSDWTWDTKQARDFQTSLKALAHCLRFNIPEAEVLVKFSNPGRKDSVVPVQLDHPGPVRAAL
jgi:aminoglycoside phosphotransferase (APT) family kinase protein